MSVKNIITVTNRGVSPILSIAQGTDSVEFDFKVADYDIPADSSAVAYNIQPTGNIVNQLCSISGNTISITPRAYFFLRGKNYMQFRITCNGKNLFSFLIEVWCSPNITEVEVSEVQDPTVVTQVLSKLEEINLKIDSVDTRLGNRINNIVANNNPTEGNTELIDIRSGYDGTTYPSAGEAIRKQIGSLSEDLGDIENATTVTISSKNLLNINDLDFLKNKILDSNGSVIVNENNSTTGFISCENGDNFVLGYVTSLASQELTRQNPVFVYLFDKNKKFLLRSPQYPAVDLVYTVDNENARYIRMTAANSFFDHDYIMMAKTNTNLPFEVYFAPYKILKNQSDVEELKSDVEELKSDVEELKSDVGNVNKYIIDCWGDSRTEMIADNGTSYCDYLKALLGSEFHVQNYGESSQSSGMCAARFGSNELFMTFPDNKLNASGVTNLSAIECTSGNDRNVYEYSKSRYIYGSLNGVYGRFERTSIASFDNVKFTRISDGLEVPIKPRTKLVVDDVSQREHINIFWWGKNDFASALEYVVSGVIDNYDKAVKWLGHKYFIILGETCSLTSSYEVGGSDRIKLDEINNTLKKKYPNNFIDINEYLSSEQALTDVGLTITDADTENISKGFPCEQLMVHITDPSDTVHQNEKGRKAIAHKIHEFIRNKKWATN